MKVTNEELVMVCRTLIDNALEYMNGDYTPYFFCHFCDATLTGWNAKEENFKHLPDCPVLIAQDFLKENE